MPGLLNIYDATVNPLARGADISRSADHSIGVSNWAEFGRALDGLAAQGKTFDRVVISTHGNEGVISFGKDAVNAATWGTVANRGWEKIFPSYTRIYFTGCHVAGNDTPGDNPVESAFHSLMPGNSVRNAVRTALQGGPHEKGWRFLEEAGKALLRGGGGLVFAHDSYGYAIGGKGGRALTILLAKVVNPAGGLMQDVLIWLGLKGKVVHPPWDNVWGVWFMPGGSPAGRVNLT